MHGGGCSAPFFSTAGTRDKTQHGKVCEQTLRNCWRKPGKVVLNLRFQKPTIENYTEAIENDAESIENDVVFDRQRNAKTIENDAETIEKGAESIESAAETIDSAAEKIEMLV